MSSFQFLDFPLTNESSIGGEEENADAMFCKLIALHTRTSLLSDIYATAGYSRGRAAQKLRPQSLLGRTLPNPLQDLGSMNRACVWEKDTLKTVLSSLGIDFTPSHDLPSSLFGSATAAVAHGLRHRHLLATRTCRHLAPWQTARRHRTALLTALPRKLPRTDLPPLSRQLLQIIPWRRRTLKPVTRT